MIVASAVAVALGLTGGCSQPEKPTTGAGKIKIGFMVKQPEEQWFEDEWKFAKQAADADGFDLITIGATDGDKVLAGIDNLATQGAQGFVICTPDTKLGRSIVDEAAKHNLKLISVDDQFVDKDGKPMTEVHHMGISATEIGKVMGQALVDEMKKRGWTSADTAAMVMTWEQLETSKQRTEGAISVLTASGFPSSKIYKAPQKTTDVPGGLDAANIALVQHLDVKHWLVCGMNDEAVLGAVRALENHSIGPDRVIGVGIGGTKPAQKEFARNTGFFATVLISPKRHGYETSDLMYHWIKDGKEPPKLTLTKGFLIDRQNWQQVLKDQGLSE
jgi:L-arabinose transport system substrate-binding protein